MIDILRSTIEALILQVMGPIDTWATYPGTVIAQHGNTLDVELDDQRYGRGITQLTYRSGIPGAAVTVPKGTRVAVGFDEGRRDLPYVADFLGGTPLTVTFNATTKVTIACAGDVEVTAGGSAKVTATGDIEAKTSTGNATVEATTGDVTVKAGGTIKLGAGAIKGVARTGDPVSVDPVTHSGVIGMTSVKTLAE
jgi:hypothetical protein